MLVEYLRIQLNTSRKWDSTSEPLSIAKHVRAWIYRKAFASAVSIMRCCDAGKSISIPGDDTQSWSTSGLVPRVYLLQAYV